MPFDTKSKRRRSVGIDQDRTADSRSSAQRTPEAGKATEGVAAITSQGSFMSNSAMLELQRTAGNQATSGLVVQRDGSPDEDTWDGSIKGHLGEYPVTYHTINNYGDAQRAYVVTVRNTGYTQLLFKTRFVHNNEEADREWIQIAPTRGETKDVTIGLPGHTTVNMRFVGEKDARTPDQTYVEGTMSVRRTK